jgi:hypothetical protein
MTSQFEVPFQAVDPISGLIWNESYRADCGSSRGDSVRRAFRPFETIAVRSAIARPRPVSALPDEPRYGRNFSKSGRRRYGQMRKAASIRDQSDRTDVAWVDFVIMHIYTHVRSCLCTISV